MFKGRLLHESRRQTVDFRTDPPTLNPSEWVLTFADGDQLSVSFHGIGTPDQTNAAFVRLSGRGTITGGTGCFQNATGELHAPGVAHVDTAPGVFQAEGHGTFVLEGLVRLRACKVSPDFLLEGVTPKCERAATAL